MACHSSPVKNRKSVTNSIPGSALPSSRTLLLRSSTACRSALRSSVPTPYVVASSVMPKAAAKNSTNPSRPTALPPGAVTVPSMPSCSNGTAIGIAT
jgi:hypothetical protein